MLIYSSFAWLECFLSCDVPDGFRLHCIYSVIAYCVYTAFQKSAPFWFSL